MAQYRISIPFVGGFTVVLTQAEVNKHVATAKQFIADHKKTIIVGGVTVVGVTAAVVTGRIKTAIAIGIAGVTAAAACEPVVQNVVLDRAHAVKVAVEAAMDVNPDKSVYTEGETIQGMLVN